MIARLPRERRLCQGAGRWRAIARTASAASPRDVGGGGSAGDPPDGSGFSRDGIWRTAFGSSRSVGSVNTRATRTANRREKANAAQTSRRNMSPMGRRETNTASAVVVLTILALRARPLSKTSATAPRRNAGMPTAAAITKRTPLFPPELSRSTHMTTTLVATASEDRAAPARTPPSCRDRGLRRLGTFTPVNSRANAEPALAALQGRPQRAERECDAFCGLFCAPATWFGSGRERRGYRKMAAHSHQQTEMQVYHPARPFSIGQAFPPLARGQLRHPTNRRQMDGVTNSRSRLAVRGRQIRTGSRP